MAKQYSVSEFANNIRSKYDAYGDVADDVLVDQYVKKFPVYEQNIVRDTDDVIIDESVVSDDELVLPAVEPTPDQPEAMVEETPIASAAEYMVTGGDRLSGMGQKGPIQVSDMSPEQRAEFNRMYEEQNTIGEPDPDTRRVYNTLGDEGITLDQIPKNIIAGGVRSLTESAAGLVTSMADMGLTSPMMNPSGGLSPLSQPIAESERAEIRAGGREIGDNLRILADKIPNKLGVTPEMERSNVGQVLQGVGQIATQTATRGLDYPFNAYSQSVRRAEETFDKPYAEFTDEEYAQVLPAHVLSAGAGFVLNRVAIKQLGATKAAQFFNKKTKLDGNTLGRMFKSFAVEGAEEGTEAVIFETLATVFYDQGNEIFSAENVEDYILNVMIGGSVGTTYTGGMEFTGSVFRTLSPGKVEEVNINNIGQASPELISSLLSKPRFKVVYEVAGGETRESVVYAETEAEALEVLSGGLAQQGEILTTKPVEYTPIVATKATAKEDIKPGDEYVPVTAPETLDVENVEALANTARDRIDLYGEEGLFEFVKEVDVIEGPEAAAYAQAEGDNYINYKQANEFDVIENITATDTDNSTVNESIAQEKQAELRIAKLKKFRAGRKFLKLEQRKADAENKLLDLDSQLEDTIIAVEEGNLTSSEASQVRTSIRQQKRQAEKTLQTVDAAIDEQSPKVIKRLRDDVRVSGGRSAIGRLIGDQLEPVSEVLDRIDPRIKGLFRKFELNVGKRTLSFADRVAKGSRILTKLKKSNNLDFRELARLITLDPDSQESQANSELQSEIDAAREAERQRLEQAEAEGIDPSQVPVIPVGEVEMVNGIPIINSNDSSPNSTAEEQHTLVDQFGNVINEGTRLPLPRQEIPEESRAPISGIRGAKLPKNLSKANVTYRSRVKVNYESDVDRALYIVRPDGTAPSKQQFMDWLTNTLGVSKKDVMEMSREVVEKTRAAGKIAFRDGMNSINMDASTRLVEAPQSDTYLNDLSENARNAFKFVRVAFPDVEIIVGGTLAETRANIVQTLKGKIGLAEATSQAEQFTDMDNGAAIFKGGKPIALVINDAQANSTTVAHEAWELILNEAFRGNTKRMRELQQAVDKQLRQSGFGAMADNLAAFANQYDGDVRYSEYLAEFGATLVEGGFDPNNLNQKQKSLLNEIKKIINGLSRVLVGKPMFLADATADNVMAMFVNVAHQVSRGDPETTFNMAQQELDLDGDIETKKQLDTRLTIPGEQDVPKAEVIPIKAGASPEAVMKRVRHLVNQYPNALSDRSQWVALMSRIGGARQVNPDGSVSIPRFPEGLGQLTTVEGVKEQLKKVTDQQRKLATEGLKGGQEIRKMYESGKMDETDTGYYFLWNILSIGISPYPQESAFLQALDNDIGSWIEGASKGEFNLDDYLAWVDTALPKGLPGSGAKSNLRAFGKNFLTKAALRIEGGEFNGMTRLEGLHQILSDKDTPTLELRNKWQTFATNMSFNNKIFDFILLTTGRQDLYVIDRVRTDDFWDKTSIVDELQPVDDKGRILTPDKTTLYDGAPFKYGKSSGAGYSRILSDISGLIINEVATRQTRANIQQAYKELGVTNTPDVGRFHWETWVAQSAQEVTHGSIDAVLQMKDAGNILDAGVRNGKYGDWSFNFTYIKKKGEPFSFEFTDNDGNVYVFDNIDTIQQEITNQNTKKTYDPENRFILKDKNGNIIKRKTSKSENLSNAWYDESGIDTQAYFEYLQSKATEVRPSPDVVEDQGIVIKRQRSTPKPIEGVTYVDESANRILNISEDDKQEYRNIDPATGLPRTKRHRSYTLKPDAMQLQELQRDLAKDPNNKELRQRVDAKRQSYREKAGLVPGSPFVEMPITLYNDVPVPATSKEVAYTVSNKTAHNNIPIVGVNTQIEDGVPVALRYDVNAYENFKTWVVSMHDGTEQSGGVIGYGGFARINNVQFFSVPTAAMNIAAGKAKAPIARMFGSFVNDTADNIVKEAKQFMKEDGWTQIGMNPERASYFYNKGTGKPIISADQVVQVGSLVLAKNAVEVNVDNPRVYQKFNSDKITVRFQKNNPNVINPKKRAELIGRRDELLRKHDLYDWFHSDVRGVLNELFDEQVRQGTDVEFIRDYFPRAIDDKAKLKKKLGLSDKQADAIISRVNANRKDRGLNPLDANQEAIAIENFVRRNFNALPAGAKVPGNIKSRDVDLISDEMLDSYVDPVEALNRYILDAVTAIETKRLIGGMKPMEGETQVPSGALGKRMNELRRAGQLSDGDFQQITGMVRDIFSSKKPEGKISKTLRMGSYNTLLTNLGSTLVQLKDIALTLYRYGFVDTARGFVTNKVALEDLGKAGKKITQELETMDEGYLGKLFRAQTFITGFSAMDKKMKTASINAAYLSMQRAARSDKNSPAYKNLVSHLKFLQGDQYIFTISGLKAGTKNDYVIEAIYNELADVQPIGRFEMPLTYNRNPGSRIWYNLRSFQIRHFAYIRKETLNKVIPELTTGKKGNYLERLEGLRNLMQIMGYMVLTGVPVDAVVAWLRGKPLVIEDIVLENMLLATGVINKYTLQSLEREGPTKSFLGYVTPAPMSIFETAERVMRADSLAPLAKFALPGDDLWYWRYSDAGRDSVREERQRLAKEGKYGINFPGPVPMIDPPKPLIDPKLLGF
tara:strand:+ start:8408 stop:16333 length:7926 start_codon:yes stop_codon:yes gene_type:complete